MGNMNMCLVGHTYIICNYSIVYAMVGGPVIMGTYYASFFRICVDEHCFLP